MKYAKPVWKEGQPYSTDFEDLYFSADNGVEETEHVFIKHNQLAKRFAQCKSTASDFVIAETGFGSGLNFLITARHWLECSDARQSLYFYSVESTPFSVEDLIQAHAAWPELQSFAAELQQQYVVASYGYHYFELFDGRIRLVLMIGDVEPMLQQMQATVDAWFLDGFAPSLNPRMWSESVFTQIKRLSKAGTTFSTYTAVGDVKRGLMATGFEVEKVSGCGNKRHMLKGEFQGAGLSMAATNQPWYETAAVKNKTPHKSICIVGAGIAGLCAAWSLIKRGYTVEILEAGEQLGAQASGNPRAMLMPRLSLQDSADGEFYTSAYFYALRCLQRLDHKQLSWQQTGGIQLPSSQRIKKHIAEYPQDDSLAVVLDADKASELAGITIREKVHYFPGAACLYPRQVLQQLVSAMGDALHIRYNCEVKSFGYENSQWHIRNGKNELINVSDCLILASAWQTKRFEQLQHLYLQPARGQLSLLDSNPQSQSLHMPVSYDGYILPESDSQHVSGASFELDDCATELRDEEHQQNLSDIQQWFSELFDQQSISGGRASVRAVSPDRVPIVGPAPVEKSYCSDYADLYKGKPAGRYPLATYWPDLYISTAHGARGFTSAFLSAELLAAYICDEPLPVSNRVRYALHPARFLIRSLKKKKQANKRPAN